MCLPIAKANRASDHLFTAKICVVGELEENWSPWFTLVRFSDEGKSQRYLPTDKRFNDIQPIHQIPHLSLLTSCIPWFTLAFPIPNDNYHRNEEPINHISTRIIYKYVHNMPTPLFPESKEQVKFTNSGDSKPNQHQVCIFRCTRTSTLHTYCRDRWSHPVGFQDINTCLPYHNPTSSTRTEWDYI